MARSRKKIDWLFVLPSDSLGGGAEQLQLNLVKYLVEDGQRCQVFMLRKKYSGKWESLGNNYTIKYLPFTNIYLAYVVIFPMLIYYACTHKIIHTFSSQTLINGLLGFIKKLGFFRRTKVIVRESNSIFELLSGNKLKLYALAYKLGYSKVDLVICQTEYMKDQLIASVPRFKEKLKIIVLPNPVNLKDIKSRENEYVEGVENLEYIVAAGRLVPVKGFDILLKAFIPISKSHPNLSLLILGEGGERANLEQQIKELGLESKVQLKGFVQNVFPYFRKAKLCVMSSRIEGFPNVLLQMMSQNHKVVSTISAGGIADIEGVFTCPIENVDLLSQAVQDGLSSDTQHIRAIFDADLNKRTVSSFLKNVRQHIE